ncbi:hypothetical protein JW979_08635 [bacterium]|nr:hypothetical protein [candidate division CSSED10-310 bacterium]
MPPIRKRICLPKYLLIPILAWTVMALVSSVARAQTGSNGNTPEEPENQVVLAMDAANYGSADLALFFLLLDQWFPNPVIDFGYRGAAGTYHFHLNKGSSAELWLVPVESIEPNDGTVSLGWNIWSDDGELLIDGTATTYSAPISGNSGDLGIHTYTLVAPKVDIVNADVTTDAIQLRLEPRGVSGTLTLELIDPDSHIIRSEVRAGSTGTLTETFDINNLAVGEYQKVKATWDVSGVVVEDEFELPEGQRLDVLGFYEHTQYNTPREADCGGNATSACLITDNQCTYQQIDLRSEFLDEAIQNGSGTSINHGRLQWGAWCANNGYPPPSGCAPANEPVRTFEEVAIYEGACGDPIVANGTVAVGLDPDDLSPQNPDNLACGDKIFIYHPDYPELQVIKTVTDRCPGCTNEQHVDNYVGESGCNENTFTYPGNPMTIRLF